MKYRLYSFCVVGFLILTISASQAQWIKAGGPSSGALSSFAVKGANLFVGTWGAGVFRSTDNGASWISVNSGLTNLSIESIAVLDSSLVIGSDDGVFRSTDNGANWVNVDMSATTFSFAVFGSKLIAGTTIGVYLSPNDAIGWTPTNLTDSSVNRFAVIGTSIIAYDNKQNDTANFFVSTDTGSTWKKTHLDSISKAIFGGSHIEAFAVMGNKLFAGTWNKGVFLSTDLGTHWKSVNNGLLLQDTGVVSLNVSGTKLFAGTWKDGVFLSTDYGSSWTSVDSGLNKISIARLASNGTYLFAGPTNCPIWRRPLSEMTGVLTAKDTQAVPFSETGSTNISLSGDTNRYVSHRIDLVNNSGIKLVIKGATLTTAGTHFKISQLLPGTPDTVKPSEKFSMIVDFLGDNLGTVFRDTILLTIDHGVTSSYIYMNGYSINPLSVKWDNSEPRSTIYPNPATSIIHYRTSSTTQTKDMEVCDILGRKYNIEFLSADDNSATYSIRSLKPGVYFVNDGKETVKFLIAE